MGLVVVDMRSDNLEPGHVAHGPIIGVLGVPLASDECCVILGENRVEDWLPVESWRVLRESGRGNYVEFLLPNWPVQRDRFHNASLAY